jgi:DNA-binding CsgD family transcriptional regulator
MDVPLYIVQDYLENFQHVLGQDGEEAAGFTMTQAHATGQRVVDGTPRRNHAAFMRCAFYNRVLKFMHGGWVAALPLRHADSSPLASVNVGRALSTVPFSHPELALLEQVQPWLEHLARKEGKQAGDAAFIGNGGSASLLIDAQGKVLSASAFALTLLHQAADTPVADRIPLQQTVQGDVSILLRRFSGSIANAMNALSALPPSLVVNNRWGRFHLLAYILNSFEAGMPMQISLHIERQVPLSLGLFRLPSFLNLSPREREVCLHILAGLSHTEIAREMRIKPSTVIYFTRQLYQRLDIHRQVDLLPALMRAAAH